MPKITNKELLTKPEDVGCDGTRLEAVNKHFIRLMEEDKCIQSVNYCLSRNGKVFANTAIGKQSFKEDDNRDLQVDAVHWIASISKIICATAIFKLFEDGYIRPLQPVADVLPEFNEQQFKAINIAHLLTHTSGLYPDEGCLPLKYVDYWDMVNQTKEGESWVATALKTGTYKEPGKEWAYCSFGFALLGEIIHRVSGMTAEAYIRKTILEPCGMTSSGFKNEMRRGELSKEFVLDIASRFYIQDEGDVKMFSQVDQYKQGQKGYKNGFDWSQVPGTAGGMFSTADDLNKFGRMLINGGVADDGTRVIGRKAIERMILNFTDDNIKDYTWGNTGNYRMYALGPDTRWNADSHFTKGSFFHEGSGACCLLMDPAEKMVASWFVPWAKEGWFPQALFNASAVMWSCIK